MSPGPNKSRHIGLIAPPRAANLVSGQFASPNPIPHCMRRYGALASNLLRGYQIRGHLVTRWLFRRKRPAPGFSDFVAARAYAVALRIDVPR